MKLQNEQSSRYIVQLICVQMEWPLLGCKKRCRWACSLFQGDKCNDYIL